MTIEEIEKLGLTIHKRLGKKANILWRDAERDLILANILRNHITRVVKYEPTKITPDYKIEANVYYKYISQKLDDEGMIFITEWLRSNINKDILREWLDDETMNKELKAYKLAYEWKCNGVAGTYEEVLDKAKRTIIVGKKEVKGIDAE